MFRKAICQHGMFVMDQLCCGCYWLVLHVHEVEVDRISDTVHWIMLSSAYIAIQPMPHVSQNMRVAESQYYNLLHDFT